MIALVVTIKVEPENQPAFEAALGELADATRANEPGVKLYQLCKSRQDARGYHLLELYESQGALDSHMESDWFKAAGPKLRPLFAEPAKIEYHDTVG